MKINKFFQNIAVISQKYITYLNPSPTVGGLSISDTLIVYTLIKDGRVVSESIPLELGVVVRGEVRKRDVLLAALQQLHAKVGKSRAPLYIIVTLPNGIVFTQSFTVPAIEETKLDDAARLNLQMLTPIDPESSYLGWQQLGTSVRDVHQTELLGAFTERKHVDVILQTLRDAHFVVAAAEFSALSLTRTLTRASSIAFGEDPFLFVRVSGSGVTFFAVRENDLYFTRFYSWADVREGLAADVQIDEVYFKDFLMRETQKVLNFYTNHWGGSLKRAAVIGNRFQAQAAEVLLQMFALEVEPVPFKEFTELDQANWSSLGGALRGLVARSKDMFLTLTPSSVYAYYWRERLLMFARIWEKVITVSFAGVFIIFVISFIGLARQESSLSENPALTIETSEIARSRELQREAQAFNAAVDAALTARNMATDWRGFFEELRRVLDVAILVDQVSIRADRVIVKGIAPTEIAAVNFKNRIEEVPQFTDVLLPFSDISVNSDNTVSFSLSFSVSSLEFETE